MSSAFDGGGCAWLFVIVLAIGFATGSWPSWLAAIGGERSDGFIFGSSSMAISSLQSQALQQFGFGVVCP